MSHATPDDLVLLHYREPVAAGLREHVFACPDCRQALADLARDLDALGTLEVPEPGPDYGDALWARLQPELRRRPAPPRRVFWLGAAAAAAVVLAFLAGREVPRVVPPPATVAIEPGDRERVLRLAVGEHLERSQRVLVEVLNTPARDEAAFTLPPARAEELLGGSRLYRQAATQTGEPGVALVLEELERVLLAIAHLPEQPSAAELRAVQQRIQSRGLLFKVRVLGEQVREREERVVRSEPGTSS